MYNCEEINIENEEAVADIYNAKSILLICEPFRQDNILNKFKIKPDVNIRNYGFIGREIAGIYDIAIIDGASVTLNAKGVFMEVYPYLSRQVKTFYIYIEND